MLDKNLRKGGSKNPGSTNLYTKFDQCIKSSRQVYLFNNEFKRAAIGLINEMLNRNDKAKIDCHPLVTKDNRELK